MKHIKHVVYDWDGTLCDSIVQAIAAMAEIYRRCYLPPPSIEQVILEMTNDILAFYRAGGVTATDEQIEKWYLEHAGHHANKLFADVHGCLGLQRTRGLKISLVSAQRQHIIDDLFANLGCQELFDAVVVEVRTAKGPAFVEACRQVGVPVSESLCVGDIRSDVEQAHRHGLIPVWINRHRFQHLAPQLRAAGAAHVVEDLHELNRLILAE